MSELVNDFKNDEIKMILYQYAEDIQNITARFCDDKKFSQKQYDDILDKLKRMEMYAQQIEVEEGKETE